LNGATLDPGVYYLAISNEPIFSNQARAVEFENRVFFLWENSSKMEKDWSGV